MKFIETNVNPKNKNAGDCVIRAIAFGLNQTWDETYKELCELGFKLKDMPSCKSTYKKYLKNKGYEMGKMPKKDNGKRYTVKEFANKNKKGTYIISVVNHLTVIKDGNLYDTWDCSSNCCGNIWKVAD